MDIQFISYHKIRPCFCYTFSLVWLYYSSQWFHMIHLTIFFRVASITLGHSSTSIIILPQFLLSNPEDEGYATHRKPECCLNDFERYDSPAPNQNSKTWITCYPWDVLKMHANEHPKWPPWYTPWWHMTSRIKVRLLNSITSDCNIYSKTIQNNVYSFSWWPSGGIFRINIQLTSIGIPIIKDKTVIKPSYFYNGNHYYWKDEIPIIETWQSHYNPSFIMGL